MLPPASRMELPTTQAVALSDADGEIPQKIFAVLPLADESHETMGDPARERGARHAHHERLAPCHPLCSWARGGLTRAPLLEVREQLFRHHADSTIRACNRLFANARDIERALLDDREPL